MTGLRITRLIEAALPLEVNSLFVGPDGDLSRIEPRERPFGFTFESLGLAFSASTKVRHGKVWLTLMATFGPLPYTAESPNRRREAFAILRASETLPHGRLALSPNRQIELSSELPLIEPLTPVNVVSAAAELVIKIAPLVGLLTDFVACANPPRAAAG